MPHRALPPAAAAILLAWSANLGAGSSAAPVSPDSLPVPERVSFHDYEFDVPTTEGWELVARAPEDEAIEIRLRSGQGKDAVTQGDISVSRIGLYDPGIPRIPRLAFQALGSADIAASRSQASQRPDLHWLGARVDSTSEGGRTFYRVWYGLESRSARGDAWVVFWFPPSFAQDGFYIRAALQTWQTQDRSDPLVPEEFADLVRSLSVHRAEIDPRITSQGADSTSRSRNSLPFTYYDARSAVLNSPHDTTRAACWTQLEDSLAVGLQPTRLPGVVFASFRSRVPEPTDRSPGDRFGKAFDRNGDGRFDLVFLSQGWAKGQDDRSIRTFYVLADDDFDGRIDGVIYEDGDNDQDGKVDHELYVQDRARTGKPDRAWVFTTDIGRPIRPVPHQGTLFNLALASRPNDTRFDLGHDFVNWTRYLNWLNRAQASCGSKK